MRMIQRRRNPWVCQRRSDFGFLKHVCHQLTLHGVTALPLVPFQQSHTKGRITGPRRSPVGHRDKVRQRSEIANTIRLTPTGPTIARGVRHLFDQPLLGVRHHSGRLIVQSGQPMAVAGNAELVGRKRTARVYMDQPVIGGRRHVPLINGNCRSCGRIRRQHRRANRCQRIQQKQVESFGHQNLHHCLGSI